jgi:hypothetical protein
MSLSNMPKKNLAFAISGVLMVIIAIISVLWYNSATKEIAVEVGYTTSGQTAGAYMAEQTAEIQAATRCDFDLNSGSFINARPAMKKLAANIAEGRPALYGIEGDNLVALQAAMAERHAKDASLGCRWQDMKAAVYRMFH